MRKLNVDLGIEEFEVDNGKILRFNPSDINLYDRFCSSKEEFLQIEQSMVEKAEEIGESMDAQTMYRLLAVADAKMKVALNRAFGTGNDFFDIFNGVNVMSVASNGERVITNFIAAVAPILEEGAKRAAKDIAAQDAEEIRKSMQGYKK